MAAKSWLEFGNELAQIVVLIGGAPLVFGAHQKLKASFAGEPTRPLLAEYRSLWRLLRKDGAIDEGASVVSRVAPYGLVGLAFFAAALTPLFSPTPIGGLGGDLFVLFGLWVFSKCWLSLSAMESPTRAGLSAGRSLTLFMLLFPAFLLSWFVALEPSQSSAPFFVEPPDSDAPLQYTVQLHQVLALFSFGMVLLLELAGKTAQTELEGAFGGRLLALSSYASQLWRMIWYALFAVYFIPPLLGATTTAGAGINAGKILLLVVVYAFAESRLSRSRFFTYHEYAAIALGLAFLANVSFALGG